jgi:hypothetical protein
VIIHLGKTVGAAITLTISTIIVTTIIITATAVVMMVLPQKKNYAQ